MKARAASFFAFHGYIKDRCSNLYRQEEDQSGRRSEWEKRIMSGRSGFVCRRGGDWPLKTEVL